MTDSLLEAIETMRRAMNGSAAAYRTQLHRLIDTAFQNDRLIEETHNWSAAVKKLEAERDTQRSAFQTRVAVWMQETFGPEVSAEFKERGFRFGEEAIELLQANGTTKEDILKLVDYVYGRPVGELQQEVGGTMVTLAALCEARGIDLMGAALAEQARVESPETRAKIQDKQEAKRVRMIATPLPGVIPTPPN